MIITTPTSTVPFFRRFDSPIGRIEVTGDADAITSLSIEADGSLPHDGVPERANRSPTVRRGSCASISRVPESTSTCRSR